MTQENDQPKLPVEVWTPAWPPGMPGPYARAPYLEPGGRVRRRKQFAIALLLFLLTLISTLAVGVQFANAYAMGRNPDFDEFFSLYVKLLSHPSLLVPGIPFAFTLLGILLAHELGHFFACRAYGIDASYPYFIPAPTLIGTLGAFIRIRSPIPTRGALFDVGIAGPFVGFCLAIPALAFGVAHSKVVAGAELGTVVHFGTPLAMRLLMALLKPGVAAGDLVLHPIGRAAWVGLFATALNLIPAGQLDGGHILYALDSRRHARISLAVAIALVPLAYFFWWGWLMWAVLLLALTFRHPPLINPWQPLGGRRVVWSLVALAMFVLCFLPMPISITG
ncbi:MAG: site-2 protease family protein [Candidatus Acidiferrales bacterium]